MNKIEEKYEKAWFLLNSKDIRPFAVIKSCFIAIDFLMCYNDIEANVSVLVLYVQEGISMKRKMTMIATTMLFLLLCLWPVTVYGASSGDYTYEIFQGTPGHKGDAYAGRFYMDRDGRYPKAFFEEGSSRQVKNIWVCAERYYQGVWDRQCWYYFPDSNFVPERWVEIDGKWYYMTTNGAASGWMKTDGNYYYFDPAELYMWTSGEAERDGVLYTIGKDGLSHVYSELGYSGSIVEGGDNTGWSEESGRQCFLRDGAKIYSEWLKDGEKWYYIDSDGYLTKGTMEVDGTVYSFSYKDGHMETDKTGYYNKQKYQFGADGKGVPLEMTTEERIWQSEVVEWMKATYAIYNMDAKAAQMMGASYNVKELLQQDWGITDRENGLEMIAKLESSGNTDTDKDSKAWNYSRAMLLCDSLYQAKYISLEEKTERQFQIAPAIQASFSSWDDFNAHYLNGFSSWAYSVGRGDSVTRRRSWYDYLKSISDNPFLIDWNLKMEKDW